MTRSTRRCSAAVATVALLAAGSAALTSPANAAAPLASSANASATATSWFHDPVSKAGRKAEIAVPKHPAAYTGKLRHTTATDRTYGGSIAVPVGWAEGHALTRHQAVVLSGGGLFAFDKATLTKAAKKQIKNLNASLTNVASVRCEGFTDYAGSSAHEKTLSKKRAAAVCARVKSLRSAVKTTAVGYGAKRPVIVGGVPSDRAQNRRVVLEVTAVKKAGATVPSAPTLTAATGGDRSASITFTASKTTGGSPIMGYNVSVDGGASWSVVPASGAGPFTVIVTGLTNGTTYSVKVRSLNSAGVSPSSNAKSVTPSGLPGAPSITEVDGLPSSYPDASMQVSFTSATSNGSPVTSYEYSINEGTWTPFAYTAGSPNVGDITANIGCPGAEADLAVRAVNANGAGPAGTIVLSTVALAPSCI